MSFRNLSPQEMFFKWALANKPQYKYAGSSKSDFEKWKAEAYPKVLSTLGEFPARVDLNPRLMAEWEHDGLIKERWLIDVGDGISAIFLMNKPKELAKDEKRPAILCCHGHGANGKDGIMGNIPAEDCQKAYGHAMAKASFITYAIDWIGFGERNDNQKPNFKNTNGKRDWCNIYYLHATMMGMTPLSINVTQGKAATDFACSFDCVDSENIGVMGCSLGGTMTLWMALCDDRFKAIEIICYSDLWAYFGIRDLNYCGNQVTPGLFKLVDLPDLQGLLAPRPLLIDIGANDTCFRVDTAMECFNKVKTIYTSADVTEKLELDLHPGEHGWEGNKSVDFFNKNL